ncbi:MAG: hypothetical protein DMG67_07030 [Acidobacteria bacterium]|nr:MAG: hypothetical protein DMG67_07030 [Acidobacteriota bacterium]
MQAKCGAESVNLTGGGDMARKFYREVMAAVLLLMVSLATAPVVQAQTQAQEAGRRINQLAPDEHQAIMELMTNLMPRDSFEKRMEQVREQMFAQVSEVAAQQRRPLPYDASERMQRAMKNAISYEDVLYLTAEAYVKHFTAAEIREIADFYNMPVGRKLARLQPEIMADIMPKISDTINDRVLKAMQREGLTIRSVSSNQ